jgi:hypothetical protein
MFQILRPALLVLCFLLTCVARVFAVETYLYEVDASGNRVANPAVHCTGETVRYKVDSDSYNSNNRTRVDVTGGDVISYSYANAAPSNGAAGTSERISSHEVVMAFHSPAEMHNAIFTVQWTTAYQQNASIRTVIYLEAFSIGWTEDGTESRFPQNIFLSNAYPSSTQGTYTVCSNNTIQVNAYAVGATSYTWTTNMPAVQINGNGTYYPTTTTGGVVQVTIPSSFNNGDYVTISVKATGGCGTSTPPTTLYVQKSCTASSSGNVSFIRSQNSTTCQPRYNVRASTVPSATSYTATLHGGGYEGYSKTVYADPYAYYVDFPFDIPGPFPSISASVTVTSPGGTSSPTYSATQSLAGGSGCRVAQTSTTVPAATPDKPFMQSVYPNPATDQVTITGLEQDAQVMVYNTLGACVKRVTLPKDASELSINLLDLSAGIYQVNVVSGSQVLRSSKLAVQH